MSDTENYKKLIDYYKNKLLNIKTNKNKLNNVVKTQKEIIIIHKNNYIDKINKIKYIKIFIFCIFCLLLLFLFYKIKLL